MDSAWRTFTNFGLDLGFNYTAFHTTVGDVVPVFVTSTRVELSNPETGAHTVLTGTGLAAILVNGQLSLSGTVTGMTFLTPTGDTTFTIAGVVWGAASLLAATRALVDDNNFAPIDALLNLQPITFDASNSVQGLDINADALTINQTIIGSRFGDDITGSLGNDR